MDRVRIFGAKYRYMAWRLPATVRVFLPHPGRRQRNGLAIPGQTCEIQLTRISFHLDRPVLRGVRGGRRAGSSRRAHLEGLL